jgi:hypothetical protein
MNNLIPERQQKSTPRKIFLDREEQTYLQSPYEVARQAAGENADGSFGLHRADARYVAQTLHDRSR